MEMAQLLSILVRLVSLLLKGPGATRESRIDTLFLDSSMPTDSKLSVPPGPSPRLLLSSSDAISSSSVCVSRNPCRKGCRGQERVRQVLGKGQREKIMWSAEQRYSPVTEVFKVEGERERRLVIGYKMGGTTTLILQMLQRCHCQLLAHKSCSKLPPIEHSIFQVMKKASRLYCLPKDLFFLNGPWYSCRPGGYVRFGSLLNTCSSLGSASWRLKNTLDENDPAHAEVLINIKRRFRSEMFTRGGLFIII